MFRIVNSNEVNNIFVIAVVFRRLKKFCERVINFFKIFYLLIFFGWGGGISSLVSDFEVLDVIVLLSVTVWTMRLANDVIIIVISFFICGG